MTGEAYGMTYEVGPDRRFYSVREDDGDATSCVCFQVLIAKGGLRWLITYDSWLSITRAELQGECTGMSYEDAGKVERLLVDLEWSLLGR